MPEDGRPHEEIREGILRGLYRFQRSANTEVGFRAQLLASGPAMGAAQEAVTMLEGYGVAADVWSVTSYKELHQDALLTQRHNMLHPQEEPRVSYVASQLSKENAPGVIV